MQEEADGKGIAGSEVRGDEGLFDAEDLSELAGWLELNSHKGTKTS